MYYYCYIYVVFHSWLPTPATLSPHVYSASLSFFVIDHNAALLSFHVQSLPTQIEKASDVSKYVTSVQTHLLSHLLTLSSQLRLRTRPPAKCRLPRATDSAHSRPSRSRSSHRSCKSSPHHQASANSSRAPPPHTHPSSPGAPRRPP